MTAASIPTPQEQVFEVLCEFVNAHGDDIALAVVYGSYADGRYGPLSDVDMYYVPNCPGDQPASRQVIVADVGYDLFALDWGRLERISQLREPLLPLLLEGRIVHHASSADLARMELLQQQARANLADREYRAARADEFLDRAARRLARLRDDAELSVARQAAAQIAGELAMADSLLQGRYPRQAREPGRGLVELSAPTAAELSVAQRDAFHQVELRRQATQPPAHPLPVAILTGFYEELHSSINKIRAAGERDDLDAALEAAVAVQGEIGRHFHALATGHWSDDPALTQPYFTTLGLPDLLRQPQPDLQELVREAAQLSSELQILLAELGLRSSACRTRRHFETVS